MHSHSEGRCRETMQMFMGEGREKWVGLCSGKTPLLLTVGGSVRNLRFEAGGENDRSDIVPFPVDLGHHWNWVFLAKETSGSLGHACQETCAAAGSYARRIVNMLQEPLPEMCYPLSARQLPNSQEGSKNKPRVSGWLSTHGNKGPAYVKATAAS